MKWETFLSKANQENSKLTNQEMSYVNISRQSFLYLSPNFSL